MCAKSAEKITQIVAMGVWHEATDATSYENDQKSVCTPSKATAIILRIS